MVLLVRPTTCRGAPCPGNLHPKPDLDWSESLSRIFLRGNLSLFFVFPPHPRVFYFTLHKGVNVDLDFEASWSLALLATSLSVDETQSLRWHWSLAHPDESPRDHIRCWPRTPCPLINLLLVANLSPTSRFIPIYNGTVLHTCYYYLLFGMKQYSMYYLVITAFAMEEIT